VSDPDESLEALTAQAKRTRDALAKVTEPPPAPAPESETAAQRLTRRWTEQAEAERRDDALTRRVENENPTAPTAVSLADPLRAVAREQAARRRRRRRRV
jgi:hypothetical protein